MRLATFRGPDGTAPIRCSRSAMPGRDDRRPRRASGGRADRRPARAASGRAGGARCRSRCSRCRRAASRSTRSSCSRRSAARASCSPSPATSRPTSRRAGDSASTRPMIVPKLFIKPSSAIIGPGEAVALPTVSNQLDWELELAIVIGTRGSRHPGRARARPHRRLFDHQRHLRPVDAMGCRGSRAGRLRRLLRLAQRQVGRRLRGVGPVHHDDGLGQARSERARDDAQGQRQGLAARLDLGHDLQPGGDHRLRVALDDARAGRRHRRRNARRHGRRRGRLPEGR